MYNNYKKIVICLLFKINRQNCDCPRNKIKTHFWIKYAKNTRLDRENHRGILGIFSLWQCMTTATPRAWDLNFGRPIRSENGFIAAHRRYIGARRLYFRTWARGVWNTCPSFAGWVMGRSDISHTTSVIANDRQSVAWQAISCDSCSACVIRLLNFK